MRTIQQIAAWVNANTNLTAQIDTVSKRKERSIPGSRLVHRSPAKSYSRLRIYAQGESMPIHELLVGWGAGTTKDTCDWLRRKGYQVP